MIEVANEMKLELKNWFENILNNEGSFTMPEFLVGYNNKKECKIPDRLQAF